MRDLWRLINSLAVATGGMCLVSGCASIAKQSYRAVAPASSVALRAYSGTTRVYGSVDLEDDGRRLARDGCVQIGVSIFKAGHLGFKDIQALAKEVGADVVLCGEKRPDSDQAIEPLLEEATGKPAVLPPYVHISGSSIADLPGYGNKNSIGGGMFNFNGTVTSSDIPGMSAEEVAVMNERRNVFTVTFWRRVNSS